MRNWRLFVIVCLIETAFSVSNNIISTADIELNVEIDPSATIHDHAKVKANSRIGFNVEIGAFATIGNGVEVKSYGKIGMRAIVDSNTKLSSFVSIGSDSVVGKSCQLSSFARTEPWATLGDNVLMEKYSHVDDHSLVDSGCVLDKYASVGSNSRVGENTYIGEFAKVGNNTMISRRVVLHKLANIVNEKQVKDGSVIIRTPSSNDLYMDYYERTPDIDVPAIQATFSDLINDLVQRQITELQSQCQQPTHSKVKLNFLHQIITSYLMKFHGVVRSDQIRYSISPQLTEQMKNEYHFIGSQSTTILNQQQIKNVVKLLAIDADIKRKYRVSNDTACEMIAHILSDERQVYCDSE